MATSSISHTRHVMYHVIMNNPSSVLDIGVGFGRWGFLCREMIDVFNGRVHKDQWKLRIEGIEIFEKYIGAHQRSIYDHIHIGNARDVIKTLGRYDIIIIGDMLEHLSKDDAWDLFHSAMKRANIGLILNLPMGEEWLREIGAENKHEDHLSWWKMDEFSDYRPNTYLTRLMNGMEHASMFISAADYKYAVILAEGEKAEKAGDTQRAAAIYSNAISLIRNRPEAYMSLANLLLILGDLTGAEKILSAMVMSCPDYDEGKEALASLRKALGAKTDTQRRGKILKEETEEKAAPLPQTAG